MFEILSRVTENSDKFARISGHLPPRNRNSLAIYENFYKRSNTISVSAFETRVPRLPNNFFRRVDFWSRGRRVAKLTRFYPESVHCVL